MSEYYDGTKLLSLKDLNGNTPELYLCTSNRSAGKTTYFGRLLVNRFIDRQEKFCLFYRFNYEVKDATDKFFKDIRKIFFPNKIMTGENRANGIYSELFLSSSAEDKGVSCGYAVSLNNADQLKKYSHFFSDVSRILFDEFQSETNHYCSNEVEKFISVHTSIARGESKQYRYVPVYMVANPVTLLNPYYTEMGISERLNTSTKFLRGDGFVLEQGYNESAQKAQEQSGFMKAFRKNSYIQYAGQGVYLNDSTTFIDLPIGRNRYIATLRYKKSEYAIREYADLGILYCDNHPDSTFKGKLAVTTEDMDINYVMLKRNQIFIDNMRFYFDKGCFRFKDLRCKEVILKTLAYY